MGRNILSIVAAIRMAYFHVNKVRILLTFMFMFRAWGSVVVKALLVRRSWDRSSVVSLGIFSGASDKSMCPGSTQSLKMSTRIFVGVKAAGE